MELDPPLEQPEFLIKSVLLATGGGAIKAMTFSGMVICVAEKGK